MQKMNIIAKLVVLLMQCQYTKTAQKYLNTVTYNTPILLWITSSSAMAERPRKLDQRFQMGGQFEAIID